MRADRRGPSRTAQQPDAVRRTDGRREAVTPKRVRQRLRYTGRNRLSTESSHQINPFN